ncbi:HCL064Wp [Eremothecium sinecaudum]|uniref:HCL064Wp n=1 Tax=Eremothecium sinecaudum TaxID=45286 RepID=A0A109UYM9_9SACH|nr:HCL064Wp [Eremothecium sinecaudum]AMD20087.1 HCL064Wp [Eremothecium sinecaudum]
MPSVKNYLPHTVGFALDNDDVTFPNYVPNNAQSLPRTSNGIRQLVIEKQNQRVFPTYNRLLDRMEDALVRWRPPASSHVGSSLAIHGSHPYQKDFGEHKAMSKEFTESIEQMKQIFLNCWTKDGTQSEVVEENDTASDYSLPLALSGGDSENKPNGSTFETLSPSRKTPVAFPIKPKTTSPRTGPDEDIQTTLNTYKFPVPSYYLPAALQRQRQQQAQDTDRVGNDGQTGWQVWCQFWKEFWIDLNNLLVCSLDDELY